MIAKEKKNKIFDYLKSINNYEIIEQNIYEYDLKIYIKNTFDIIFLDPPFKDKNLNKLLSKIPGLTSSLTLYLNIFIIMPILHQLNLVFQ